MLFLAVSFMGPRDALGFPAFLLYFFFILLSILQLDARLGLFTGLVAAVEHFMFAYLVIGTLTQTEFWRTPVFHFNRSSFADLILVTTDYTKPSGFCHFEGAIHY
jgi:hypothetical protein